MSNGDDSPYSPAPGPSGLSSFQPPGESDTEKDAFSKLGDFGADLKVQNDMNEDPTHGLESIKQTRDGMMDIKLHRDVVEGFIKDRQELNTIRGSMHQQMQRLEAREAQNRTPFGAIAQGLSTLSGNIATQRDMPGWARALGQTAKDLNPSNAELEARKMGLLKEEAGITEQSMRLGEGMVRIQDTQQAKQAAATMKTEEEARKVKEDQTRDLRNSQDKFLTAAEKGDAPPANVLNKLFTGKGADPKTAASMTEAITKTNEAAQARIKAENDIKTAHEKAFEKAIVGKSSDKAEADKAIEETAQALAPMNKDSLNAMTQVAGMFGSARNRIFARARELNPHFNTAEIGRMMDMEKKFTSGKGGDALASFDTFLQHAAGTTETLKNIEMTDNRLLNKSLNWWRKNMKGTPELAKLETSIEPVGKEFEKFLLATGSGSGGALYVDDRRKVDALLNADNPLSVTLATLNQMGRTAKDKFTAANQQYKRTMKQDLEYPFSEEAVAGAAKIGIKLPQGEETKSATTDEVAAAKAAKINSVVTIKGT